MTDSRERGEARPTVAVVAPDLDCDVLVVGCGVAGLYAALNLPRGLRVTMICKEDLASCDSMLAQGGICVMRDHDDYAPWFEDTMRAGHYENRRSSVDAMIWSSREVINDLIRVGVVFDRDADGKLDYTREGAHSRPRILHHLDVTGEEITTKLLVAVAGQPNVTIREHTTMVDLLVEAGACAGVVATDENGNKLPIHARDTILCTGGVGGLYEHSTNFPCLTGDGCRVCEENGVPLAHMDYVQIHPTSLYGTHGDRAFLISESCRGEGAVLLDRRGSRFVDELLPRDVVTKAIRDKMAEEGSDFVRLSFDAVPSDVIVNHFSNIHRTCLDHGYDITREPIPVVPAQHYLMGGILVDENSRAGMAHLYAAGETSCNGVHGRNRLASNSLLEGMVFARLAARDIVRRNAR